ISKSRSYHGFSGELRQAAVQTARRKRRRRGPFAGRLVQSVQGSGQSAGIPRRRPGLGRAARDFRVESGPRRGEGWGALRHGQGPYAERKRLLEVEAAAAVFHL